MEGHTPLVDATVELCAGRLRESSARFGLSRFLSMHAGGQVQAGNLLLALQDGVSLLCQWNTRTPLLTR